MKRNFHTIYACVAAISFIHTGHCLAQTTSQLRSAKKVFTRAKKLCTADNGRMWGLNLCGPVILANPQTRQFYSSMDGKINHLKRIGTVYTGHLSQDVPIANTAINWNGRKWTMLMDPVLQTEPNMSILLMHESFHRIQDQIDLKAENGNLDHLATEDGRVSLRLELRALRKAITSRTRTEQLQALEDALIFRYWRQNRFPDSRLNEDILERNEGLAEYTGRFLSKDPKINIHIATHLQDGDNVDEYARSFAYYTYPVYGNLLDIYKTNWRSLWDKQIGLPQYIAKILSLKISTDDNIFRKKAALYGGVEISNFEAARSIKQQKRLDALSAKLIEGPLLTIPVVGANLSFDPNHVTPLPPHGSVYLTIRASGDWGTLDVERDGLLSSDWSKLIVTYPGAVQTDEGMKGNGWKLMLNPSYVLKPDSRAGDWTIQPRLK